MSERSRHKHVSRYREMAEVLLDEGFGYFAAQSGLTRFVPAVRKVGSLRREDGASVEERVRRTLERLGPTFVKIGQLLSTRPDLLPPEYLLELKKLQDRVEPVSTDLIRDKLESEMGAPVEEVFTSFSEKPVASASIGQVHAATLHDGTRVVVKVQRPGIEDQVETDLDILFTQAHFLEERVSWARDYHIVENVEQFSHVLRAELDYIAEGRNAERFRADLIDDENVVIPRVYWGLTTKRVITLEMLEGVPLNRPDEVAAMGLDLRDIARRGARLYMRQIFEKGFFHVDPHPGNLFVLPDGRIGFSDFGRVGSVSPRQQEQFADMLFAIVERDADEAVDVLMDLGLADYRIQRAELERDIDALLARYYDVTLGQIRIAEATREVLRLVFEYRLRIPPEFSLMLMTFAVLEGVGTELDPGFNFVEAVRPYMSRIVVQRLSPQHMGRKLLAAAHTLGKLLTDLPESIESLVESAAAGTFTVKVEPYGFERLIAEVREIANRLAFALLVGSFVVGFSLILGRSTLPRWMLTLSQLALAGAAGVGVWLFVSILAQTVRARRRG